MSLSSSKVAAGCSFSCAITEDSDRRALRDPGHHQLLSACSCMGIDPELPQRWHVPAVGTHVVVQPLCEVLPARQHPEQRGGSGQEPTVVVWEGIGYPREEEALQMEVEMVTCWRQLNSGDFSQRGLCLRAVELKSSTLRKY